MTDGKYFIMFFLYSSPFLTGKRSSPDKYFSWLSSVWKVPTYSVDWTLPQLSKVDPDWLSKHVVNR